MRYIKNWYRPRYESSTTNQIGRKGVFALIIRAAPGLATFATNILIGRLGGTTLLGLTQSIISSASLAALFYPTPAGSAASRYIASANASEERRKSSAVARYLAVRALTATLIITLVVACWHFILHDQDTTVALVTALVVAGLSLRALIEGFHFGGGELTRLAVFSSLIAILGFTATAVMLLLGIRNPWIIAPVAILNILLAVFSWPRPAATLLPRNKRREIRVFILLGTLGTLSSAGFAQLTVLVNVGVNGLGFTGQYAGAMTLTTPVALVASALAAVLFPALAATHQQGDNASIRKRLVWTSRVLTTALIPVLIITTVCAREIVQLVFGAEYSSSPWILLVLAPPLIAGAIASPAVSAITSKSNRGMAISAASSFAGLLIGITTWFLLIPVAPELAIPVGYAIGCMVNAIIPWILVWVRYKLALSKESILLILALTVPSLIGAYLQSLDLKWWVPTTVTLGLIMCWFALRWTDLHQFIIVLRSGK